MISENKTIEQIRDELANENYPKPSAFENNNASMTSPNRAHIICRKAFKIGFDARGKIEEERTKKLVEALEFLQRNTNALDYRRPVIDLALQECGEK